MEGQRLLSQRIRAIIAEKERYSGAHCYFNFNFNLNDVMARELECVQQSEKDQRIAEKEQQR